MRIRLLAALLSPFDLFRELSVYPDLKGPGIVFGLYFLGYLAVFYVASSKVVGVEHGALFLASIPMIPVFVMYTCLLWVFVTLLYWALAKILGGEGRFLSLLSATGYAQLIGAITVFVLAILYSQLPPLEVSDLSAVISSWAGSRLIAGVVLLAKLLMTFLRMMAVDACYGLGRGRSVAAGVIAFVVELITPPFNQLV